MTKHSGFYRITLPRAWLRRRSRSHLALNLALDIALVALHGGGKVKQNDRGIWREAERVAVGVQVVRSSATCWGWDEDRGACANVCCGKSILRVVPQVAWLVAQSV